MKKKEFLGEIRSLDDAGLKERAGELRSELLKNRFRRVSGQQKTTHLARVTRKQLAQVETVIREKVK